MSAKDDAEKEKAIKDYLTNNFILIVDSVSSARSSLAINLEKMGANRNKMVLVGSLAEAREELKKKKYKLIFSDFNVGSDFGLDLIQEQRLICNNDIKNDSIFILVTSNASQAAVARAAEDEADTYIIKPYSLDMVRESVEQAVYQRIKPNRYRQLIEQGKSKLFDGEYDEAISFFAEAKGEIAEPVLACFYYGQAEFIKTVHSSAEVMYRQGLFYSNIHHKCLVGLYDLLLLQKRYTEAYDVIKRLTAYYPANQKRMASALKLVIITENFQDMDHYFKTYEKFTVRNEDLKKYMCSALLVCGKFYLKLNEKERALEYFENATLSAGNKVQFLFYIIENLINFKMLHEAEQFFIRLSGIAAQKSAELLAAKYLISTIAFDLSTSMALGHAVLKEGAGLASVYEKLITQTVLSGKKDQAESLFEAAVKLWPSQESNFLYAMESDLRESQAQSGQS